MNNNAEDQEIKGLLREAYQTPSPDPAFVRVLRERLKQELTDTSAEVSTRPAAQPPRTSRPARRWGWIAGTAAAAAAVVLLAVGVYFLRPPGGTDRSQEDRKVAQAGTDRENKESPELPHVGFNAYFDKFLVAPKRPPLVKEPAYQSKTPKYAVLAFGAKADTRVWVVLDLAYDFLREKPGKKDSLYIDLNGNGDLTDLGERIPVDVITSTYFDQFVKKNLELHLPQFKAGDIVSLDGKAKYTGLTVDVGWPVPGQRYRRVTLKVNVPGRGTQSVSSPLLRFADKPADAPVLHFDGPLAMRLNMSPVLHCPVDYTGKEAPPPWYEQGPLVRGEECELTAEIGTPGVGPGTFALLTANIPPAEVHPIAEIEFRHHDSTKPTIKVKVELTQRCCGTLFKGKISVPKEAAAGKALVSVSFPAWADGNVSSTDAEVTVVDAPKVKASVNEQAVAEKVVAELTRQDFAKLSKEDLIRLSLAYNELSDHTRALDAINPIPESYLAEKGQLDMKAVLLANVNSSGGADKITLLKELAFLDRCIDRRYGNPGLWYWRKAKLLCRNSVLSLPNAEPSIVDREQFEYAFETLKRAFEVEPKLLALASVRADRRCSPQDFPILNSEPRFKKLMETKRADPAAGTVPASEPSPKDRTIAKEPAYKTKDPRYCQLVFGPRAARSVWLVIDGEDLCVDRNGNGDLTEEGDRVTRKPFVQGGGFEVPELSVGDAKNTYTNLIVYWTPQKGGGPAKEYTVEVMVEVNKQYCQYGVFKASAASPKDAPIIHFGGPLEMILLGGDLPLPAPGKEAEFAAVMGTKSSTGHSAMIRNDRNLSPKADVHPAAEITFPRKGTTGADPVRVKLALDQRCCNTRFYTTLRTPAEVGAGKATVVLTFPAWTDVKVTPWTSKLDVGDTAAPGK